MIARRRRLSRALALAFLTAMLFGGAVSSQASAAASWNLDVHHDPTNFQPGGTAQLSFDMRNIGESSTSGTVTLHVSLPAGLTRNSYYSEQATFQGNFIKWECPGAPGETSFTCTTTEPIALGLGTSDERALILIVNVAPNAGPDLVATAQISGGGAPEAPPSAGCPSGASACASEHIHVSEEPAEFGVAENSWLADFYEPDEVTPVRQAGSHPAAAIFSFDLNSIEGVTSVGESVVIPAGSLRDVQVDLPQGVVGNPTAVGECTQSELAGKSCSPSSEVGRVDVTAEAGPGSLAHRFDLSSGLYNLAHPRGAVTDLGFNLAGKVVHIEASLDPANNYSIRTVTPAINETVRAMNTRVTIWGVPGDPIHDGDREGPWGLVVKPFLTVPDRCEGANTMTLSHVDSWQNPGVFGSPVTYELPGQFTGCERPSFEPEVTVEPTSKAADSPTGLNVHIHVPQNESPNGLGTPPVKTTVVRLPEGMSFSPSFANGLTSCPLAAMRLGTNEPVRCEDSSRIGEVSLSTPLLPKPLEGSIYLAAQYDNPFGSLFAIYLVLHDNEERGILVKLAGKVEADPVTGRITTTFSDTPQIPFEDLTLRFRSGARAPLVNPAFCGTQTITGQMASWAQPDNPAQIESAYQITEGANGGPCPVGGALAFDPGLVAGTADNVAGSYSPLDLRITRNDGEQEITGFASVLPAGVSASLTGVPFCAQSAIAAARAKSGAQEEADPSCPAGSQIGRTIAEAGVGGTLAQAPGKLYMGGPFEGAPFSIISITDAKVGPYDLGTVVVHLPLWIDRDTAVVHVGSGTPDQIPHIIKGVIVHLRDIRVYVDRPNFVINPTSCEHLTLTATVIGSGQNYVSPADDVPVTVTNPFQAADCASLAFKPSFKASISAKTSRKNGASLSVSLTYPKDALGKDANIHRVRVELPKALPSRLSTLQKACTEAQFNANPAGCPAESVVGYAKAITPILPVPLEGPAYFVSRGAEWPELIMVLQGYGITIELHGETHISKGVTSSTFPMVPDQPVESFQLTLPAGPHSALAAPGGKLCQKKLIMPTSMTGQNGKAFQQKTRIQVQGCPDKLLLGTPRVKGRRLKLRVGVPAAGRLTATGHGLGKASKKASGRETLTLTLKRHSRRSHPARIRLSFTPSSGTSRKKLTRSIAVKAA